MFFWLVILELIVKFGGGRGAPCPSSLAWLINNPVRAEGIQSQHHNRKDQPYADGISGPGHPLRRLSGPPPAVMLTTSRCYCDLFAWLPKMATRLNQTAATA